MSGRGLLAKELQDKGVTIKATDDNTWAVDGNWEVLPIVEERDAVEACKEATQDILLICWPYLDNTAYECIKEYYSVKPDGLVIYVGEWDGCTADDKFFEHFKEVPDAEFNKVSALYPKRRFIRDNLFR